MPSPEILRDFRIPRAALAAVAGAGLALGGVVFQSIFRNPLATPYTLGIDAGAALGAAIGFLTLSSSTLAAFTLWGITLEYSRLTLLALAGAIGAIALVYLMSRLRGGHDLTRLLLGGVCISYLAAAGIMLATYLANRAVTNEILYWIMGSLARHRPAAVLEITAILIPVAMLSMTLHRALDLLAMGDVMAAARGVAVGRVIWGCLLSVGLLTAAIVAHCGPIGFVGLMIPHFCRACVGPRAGPLLLVSMAVGAAFLAVCDAAARSISAYEIPVGVITNILGAAFFFWLLTVADRRT
ncbi:MAG: iron ABC transporter permease [Phycisphaerales bacterium]|nr:iron ABC transporter permease [Phycisphaerales bacterium]